MSNKSTSKTNYLFELLKKGEFKFIWKGIIKRINSSSESFGLKRDLNNDFDNPNALIDLTIRHYKNGDEKYFESDLQNNGLTERSIPNCYVAVNSENIPCYRQWLIGSNHNSEIKGFWGNLFPILNENEALLEGAFTSPNFRGKRIMPAAMSRIAEKGKDLGVRWIITFVGIHNIPSLKGCMRSGFYPYIIRKERWFLFKRNISFVQIPEDRMALYNKYTGASVPKNITG